MANKGGGNAGYNRRLEKRSRMVLANGHYGSKWGGCRMAMGANMGGGIHPDAEVIGDGDGEAEEDGDGDGPA